MKFFLVHDIIAIIPAKLILIEMYEGI